MLHTLLNGKKVILASTSPRRRLILEQVGLKFLQIASDVDEVITESDHKNPIAYVKKNSLLKAQAVMRQFDEDCFIISADTIVYLDKRILEKPANAEQATEFMRQLSGVFHQVYTGVTIAWQGAVSPFIATDYEKTSIKFITLSEAEIREYVRTGEGFDKAGGYGIQGYGSQFIEKITGCYFNVMGFPVNLFYRMVMLGFRG